MNLSSQPLYVTLNVHDLDDGGRVSLVASIAKLAPQSQLYAQNKAIKTSIAELSDKGVELSIASDKVTSLEKALAQARSTRDDLRANIDRSLIALRGVVQGAAASIDDVRALGLDGRVGRASASGPLVAPQGITIKASRRERRVLVIATGANAKTFGAQITTDPSALSGWQELPGAGRTRRIEGYAPGTTVMVRFRTIRRHNTSDWCAPVAVTMP